MTDDEVEQAIEGTSMLLHHVGRRRIIRRTKQLVRLAVRLAVQLVPLEMQIRLYQRKRKLYLFQWINWRNVKFNLYKKCNKDMSYSEAQAVCEEKGAHVCSQAEMVEAFKSGYESAACGWTSTETSMGHLVEMVLKEDKPEIEGKKGFNVCALEKNLENTYGVHCCGV